MIEDNWEPAEEDVDWTRSQLERMSIGDTWGVADAVLIKENDNTLRESKASPASFLPLQRIKKVLESFDAVLITEDAELIHDPEKAAQDAAKEWTCPDTEIPIVNFDLEGAEWTHLDQDNGWRVIVYHRQEDVKDEGVALSPMDYHLVAGDELFFSWKGMRVLEREEIIALADSGAFDEPLNRESLFIMGTFHDGETIPPHLRGLIFVKTNRDEEE